MGGSRIVGLTEPPHPPCHGLRPTAGMDVSSGGENTMGLSKDPPAGRQVCLNEGVRAIVL